MPQRGVVNAVILLIFASALLHAPVVSLAQPVPPDLSCPNPAAVEALTQQLLAHLRHTARGLEDVGERFAEEARRIHYGDAESRGIKGRADGEELHDLLDEGILVLPVPPDEDLH